VFERYQRSEKALVAALAEMYVQGVSTRKVKAITEELCGHEFSASTISRINEHLDEELAKFAGRRLEEEYPYLILDARYEKVREDGVIRSRAVLIAIGINGEGRRCVLAVDMAQRESQTSWKDFFLGSEAGIERRGIRGGRRSYGVEAGDRGDSAWGGMATVLCAFSAQCLGSSATEGG